MAPTQYSGRGTVRGVELLSTGRTGSKVDGRMKVVGPIKEGCLIQGLWGLLEGKRSVWQIVVIYKVCIFLYINCIIYEYLGLGFKYLKS